MPLRTLHDLLTEQLRDLHNAMVQYRDLLPSMKINASDHELFAALEDIDNQTEADLVRVEDLCAQLHIEPTGVSCEAMRGMVREATAILNDTVDYHVIDATIITCAQRIAHYQIAGFGTARQFARVLGKTEEAEILDDLTQHASLHDREISRIANGGWFSRALNIHAGVG